MAQGKSRTAADRAVWRRQHEAVRRRILRAHARRAVGTNLEEGARLALQATTIAGFALERRQ